MNDNRKNKNVSDAIDDILAEINPKTEPKQKSKPRTTAWSNGISTTHIPEGFKFGPVFKDDMDNKEKSK